MKIKSDFITNSSTCNFVLLGFEVETKAEKYCNEVDVLQTLFPDKHIDKIHDMSEDANITWHILCGSECGAAGDKSALVGFLLYEFDSDGCDEDVGKIELIKLKDAWLELSEKFGVGRDYKLIFATRMC